MYNKEGIKFISGCSMKTEAEQKWREQTYIPSIDDQGLGQKACFERICGFMRILIQIS